MVLSLHISNIYANKRGIAKKLILTIHAVMIGQQIDVVAGDFNGTAWRCSNRDNISTVDEAFADCIANTAGPCGFLIRWVQIGIEKCACTARFPATQNSRPASN